MTSVPACRVPSTELGYAQSLTVDTGDEKHDFEALKYVLCTSYRMRAVSYTPGTQGFTAWKQNQRNTQENSRVIEPRRIWGMESGRVPRWDLLEGSLIQSTQAEPKTSGLLQQGLWADRSQGPRSRAQES